jgi:glucose-6-phosphate 1-dehydrogenase
MTTRIIPVDDFDLVIFGATGDLSQRKLLPALFHRDEQGQLPDGACIIGTSRKAMSHEEFRTFAAEAIAPHIAASNTPDEVVQRFLARLRYYAAEATKDDGWLARWNRNWPTARM